MTTNATSMTRSGLDRRDFLASSMVGAVGLSLPHYNRLPRGGHFAAWEQPQLFTEELRATFRSLR